MNVVLCSEWSTGMYPTNSGGNFTNELQSNLNFSAGGWSVALTDILYTPDTWNNVRVGSNDIEIRMKGFKRMRLLPYKLYCALAPEVHTQMVKYRGGIKATQFNATLYRSLKQTKKAPNWGCEWAVNDKPSLAFTSIWMDADPLAVKRWQGGEPLTVKPIFIAQIGATGTAFHPPAWFRNTCNTHEVDILYGESYATDDWEYETVYVNPGYYTNFEDFMDAFNLAIDDGIKKIFARTVAHPQTTQKPQFADDEYKAFNLELWARLHVLQEYHRAVEVYEGQMPVGRIMSMMTGGSPTQWYESAQGSDMSKALMKFRTIFDARFMGYLLHAKWGTELGYGDYIYIRHTGKVWVTVSKFVSAGNYHVTALSVAEEFAKETNFSLKMNRAMQHQLGFTMSPMYDMGWVHWYPRKEALETNIAALYYYGYHPPDLARNTIKSICVHCDIIDGCHVGSQKKPLLRMLPVNLISHMTTFESFGALQYRHINKNNVSSIKIWLTESPTGPPLMLHSSVFVKLRFSHG